MQSSAEYSLHISDLPDLLLLSIFSCLPLYDRLNRAALVCSHWYKLSCDACLWRACRFSDQKRLDNVVLQRILSYSKNVKSLELIGCLRLTDDGLIEATKNQCNTLRKLTINQPFYGRNKLTMRSMLKIGDIFKQLRAINLYLCRFLEDKAVIEIAHGCTQLSELNVSWCNLITDNAITAVAQFCQHLASLDISWCLDVTDVSINMLINEKRKLESFKFLGCNTTSAAAKQLSLMPTLHTLGLSAGITNDVLISLAASCSSLRHLVLRPSKNIVTAGFIRAIPYLKNLFAFHLHFGSSALDDTVMSSIGKHCPALQHLDIGICELVTNVGVNTVVQCCLQLKKMSYDRHGTEINNEMHQFRCLYPHIEFKRSIY